MLILGIYQNSHEQLLLHFPFYFDFGGWNIILDVAVSQRHSVRILDATFLIFNAKKNLILSYMCLTVFGPYPCALYYPFCTNPLYLLLISLLIQLKFHFLCLDLVLFLVVYLLTGALFHYVR